MASPSSKVGKDAEKEPATTNTEEAERLRALIKLKYRRDTKKSMTEQEGKNDHLEPSYDELAKFLLCSWIAYRLGVTLPTAKRQVEKALHDKGKQHPGAIWHHVAEYIEKLQAGYLPFDLNAMERHKSDELEEPEQTSDWVQ